MGKEVSKRMCGRLDVSTRSLFLATTDVLIYLNKKTKKEYFLYRHRVHLM